MVGVQHHDPLEARGGQPLEQESVDTLRQHHRHARVQSQDADVVDCLDAGDQVGQGRVGEGKGISAAENDFLDRLVPADAVQCLGPVTRARVGFGIGKPATEAVAAMDAAGPGRDQQHAAVVLVQYPRVPHGGQVPHRVADARRIRVLHGPWEYLRQQRIGGIADPHARRIAARDPQGEMTGAGAEIESRRVDSKQGEKLGRVTDRLGQGALPVRHVFPGRGYGYHGGPIFFRQVDEGQMASYSTNEFKAGLKIMLDGDPNAIVENEFVKPGKGQAFNRVKLRNLKTGRVVERTFKSGESVEAADVIDTEMTYLYSDGEFWHLMDPENFEQIAADRNAVGEAAKWLREQDTVEVTLFNGEPLTVTPPNFVDLRIVETDPGVRGDTAQGGTKPATLETGAVAKVPLFIEQGEKIRVDTRKGEYVSRVKE